jgi:hypothetical protein
MHAKKIVLCNENVSIFNRIAIGNTISVLKYHSMVQCRFELNTLKFEELQHIAASRFQVLEISKCFFYVVQFYIEF